MASDELAQPRRGCAREEGPLMETTPDDLWNLVYYGLLFIAWAMGFSKGGQR